MIIDYRLSTTFISYLLLSISLTVLLSACQFSPSAKTITIEVDGDTQTVSTETETVRAVLQENNIAINELDRVKPDLYTSLYPDLTIIITRITQELVTEIETIPFEQQTVINEALAPNESRLAQLGVNGEVELSIRVTYEDGLPINRTEINRQIITPAIPEIVIQGPQGDLTPVAFDGTIAYLSNGNGWLLRQNSSNRRAIVTAATFDEHVFALSPDGRYLLYTQPISETLDTPLNQLWLVSTTIIGEEPQPLNLEGVIETIWSPVVTQSLIAYSTAERVANAPGWRANNDLWLVNPLVTPLKPTQLITANMSGLYAWWGTSFSWSPDGSMIAYSRPDEVGIIHLFKTTTPVSYTITPLVSFAPVETLSEWAWVPQISWSPDSKFIATVVHGHTAEQETPQSNQTFDLWLFDTTGTLSVKIATDVGMWSNPVWGKEGLAFGQATTPQQSVNSRYKIHWVDWDGSNQKTLFPYQSEPGVYAPQLKWSAEGDWLMFVYNGNIYQTHYQGASPRQLTSDSQVVKLQWSQQTVNINTPTITTSSITTTTTSSITIKTE